MKKNDKSIILILCGVIITILVALVILFATNTISFTTKTNNNDYNSNDIVEEDNNEKDDNFNSDTNDKSENNNKNTMINVTVPSGKIISVNENYKGVFDNIEKINIINVNGLGENSSSNDSLILSDFITKQLANYPDDFYTGKKVSISNTLFDFDNDGINEIMFSFCEEFILLRYYNGKVYGYTLGGYRTNNNWRVNGVSIYSASATINGYTKYSFSGSKLVSEVVASSEGDNIYKVNGKTVNKTEFEAFENELETVALIEYVDYSK